MRSPPRCRSKPSDQAEPPTSDDEDQAKALGRGAVESKLAAGVHVGAPITAFYWWKGKVEAAQEWRISYMTSSDCLPALEAWVHEKHPYDVPQRVTLLVTGGSEAYRSWVVEETHPQ
jgi:periplasmic divalent cation tolerance protein